MKKYLFFLFIFAFIMPGQAQEKEQEIEQDSLSMMAQSKIKTAYYLIRHAEKDRSDPSNKDPNLTQQGLLRAAKWSYVLEHVNFDAVYSTNYNRTRETAEPIAERNGIDQLKIYSPSELDMKGFIAETHGKTILIVGHSNTTPAFVNKLIGQEKYAQIDDSNNANLYIITMHEGGTINDILLVVD